MQGEFATFLTVDEANFVYIETYKYNSDSIGPVCDKVFLCDKSKFEKVECRLDPNRLMISVLCYNTMNQDNTDTQMRSFLIDFRQFAANKQAESILIRDIIVDDLFAELSGRDIYDIEICFVNSKRQSYTYELLIFVEFVNRPEDPDDDKFQLFGVLMEEKFTGMDENMKCYHKILDQPFVNRNSHVLGFY